MTAPWQRLRVALRRTLRHRTGYGIPTGHGTRGVLGARVGGVGDAGVVRFPVDAVLRAGFHRGPAPYGYRRARGCVVDHAGRLRSAAMLVPDPRRARVVAVMFWWRAYQGAGYAEITRRLNADLDRSPAPSSVLGGPRVRWHPGSVRRVLTNPHYLGRRVWPAPTEVYGWGRWVVSPWLTHQPLIDEGTFWRPSPVAWPRNSLCRVP